MTDITDIITMDKLEMGQNFFILTVGGKEEMRQRLEDLGFVSGTRVVSLMKSPLGDPVAYFVRGTVIALRREDAASVLGSISSASEVRGT